MRSSIVCRFPTSSSQRSVPPLAYHDSRTNAVCNDQSRTTSSVDSTLCNLGGNGGCLSGNGSQRDRGGTGKHRDIQNSRCRDFRELGHCGWCRRRFSTLWKQIMDHRAGRMVSFRSGRLFDDRSAAFVVARKCIAPTGSCYSSSRVSCRNTTFAKPSATDNLENVFRHIRAGSVLRNH